MKEIIKTIAHFNEPETRKNIEDMTKIKRCIFENIEKIE
jgi:hypothetical protein